VEDNPGDADLIQKMLPNTDHSSFTILCVNKLSEAVSHLKSQKTDIALLDLDLPDNQGIETVHAAHQTAPEMPIVAFSGNRDKAIAMAAVQSGAQDFLVKGQTHRSHLTRVLHNAVQRNFEKEKVREPEQFLHSALDALSTHIAIVDADGYILATNKAWREFSSAGGGVFRCREKSNLFDACRKTVNDDSPEGCFSRDFTKGMRDVLGKKQNQFEMSYWLPCRSGKKWFHGQVTAFTSGKERMVVVTHENITEHILDQEEKIRLAAELRQRHKMEAIGTLASGIAHDFNNILAAVLGYVELSLLDVEKSTPLEKNLHAVHQAGIRAKELVQQILTFARKDEVHIQPTRVSTIAEETIRLIRSTIPASIDIRLTVESDALVMADPSQIHQIFMNLFCNAAQAMDAKGGVLSITICRELLDASFKSMHDSFIPGEFIKITISDTGMGIAPHRIEKIFDPYYTTKKAGEGSGLGLSVVRGIVQSHGGEITVESTVDLGTTFNVYLSLCTKTAPSPNDARHKTIRDPCSVLCS
jgi:signal transduction histidine kinase/CheY-like chemotaxis protein